MEKTTIARPYAKAVFAIALAHDALVPWSSQLAAMSVVVEDPRVAALLPHPKVTSDDIIDLITGVCKKVMTDEGENFLRVLRENRRLDLLPEIYILFEVMRADHDKTVDVEVRTARELTDKQQEQLRVALKKRLQRNVVLQCQLDESLLGGAVIRAGDLVIDGSARGQLERLETALCT